MRQHAVRQRGPLAQQERPRGVIVVVAAAGSASTAAAAAAAAAVTTTTAAATAAAAAAAAGGAAETGNESLQVVKAGLLRVGTRRRGARVAPAPPAAIGGLWRGSSAEAGGEVGACA